MADAIILAEVTIDRVETVVSLASDDVRLFSIGVSLPANNPLMSQSCTHVMECGASWNNSVGASLVLGQHLSDPLVSDTEQLGEIAVGEQSSLLVRLLAKAERLAQQPLRSRNAFDAPLHVLCGGDVEEDRDQIDIRYALSPTGGIVDTDGHPEHLPVYNVVFGAHLLEDDLKDHIGT